MPAGLGPGPFHLCTFTEGKRKQPAESTASKQIHARAQACRRPKSDFHRHEVVSGQRLFTSVQAANESGTPHIIHGGQNLYNTSSQAAVHWYGPIGQCAAAKSVVAEPHAAEHLTKLSSSQSAMLQSRYSDHQPDRQCQQDAAYATTTALREVSSGL